MKKIATAIVASIAAMIAVPAAANAAHGQPINQRQAQLEARIDRGVRAGTLTRQEAASLRARLANLEQLEWRLRRNGLTAAERRTLDHRLDVLSRSIRIQIADNQFRGDRNFRHRRG